ncbi:DUF885 domain-containing protein [Neolewinella persica]|uniref:DUF885 domain-containing protein n=1 Tax=Neolewinella persica TaxID=70998 RepID=UPI00037606B1|nr:DUF885 domain-containing protein [Neolewinella persica]
MHNSFYTSVACILLLSIGCQAQPAMATTDFETLKQAFRFGYESLEVPGFRIAYVDNLSAIASPKGIEQQAVFFTQVKKDLAGVKAKDLSPDQYLDYRVMAYETELNLARLELEADWNNNRPDTIATGGLSTVPNGKAWYRYFLKRWVDLSVEPDSLYAFGLREVKQVKAAMAEIARREERDPAVFHAQLTVPARYFHSAAEVQAACEKLHRHLLSTLPDYFPKIEMIPALDIAQNQNERMAQVPGFYRDDTFYYTYFDRPFEKRQIGWLYTHEGLPGHHYERSYTGQLSERSEIAQLFNYSAYVEGWAAYIEEIGQEFGAYPTDFDEYGKWEWDLIRSLRVPMDIGLNYYGWSDEKALSFWQEYSSGLDDIARREIARMRRWPAQVITYKYGAETFLRWQQAAAQKKDFDWIDFHTQVLQYGPLPLSLLNDIIVKK